MLQRLRLADDNGIGVVVHKAQAPAAWLTFGHQTALLQETSTP